MKVDAQIEEECRRTISYLQGYSCPKLYISFKKLTNQKRSANTFRNIRRTTLCWMRGKIEELLFIKVTVFLPLSFRKKNSAKQDIASTEIAYQFLAPKVPVLRRNKATNPSTSTDPFSAATKAFVLGNLFKLVGSAITFARAVCIGGNEKNTRRLSYFPSSLSPSGKVPVRMWWSKSMNKLPSTRAFILVQLKNGCLIYWSWWLYFSSKLKPTTLKTVESFRRCYILLC